VAPNPARELEVRHQLLPLEVDPRVDAVDEGPALAVERDADVVRCGTQLPLK
jgi:hypothetical protein